MKPPKGRGKQTAAGLSRRQPRAKVTLDKGAARQLERRRARAALGSLHENQVAPTTLGRYQAAAKRFFLWVLLESIALPRGEADFDDVACQYVEHCWQEGEPQGSARDALAGLQFLVKRLRGQLTGSWSLMKAWQMKELPARAPPIILLWLHAVVGYFLRQGELHLAVACYTGFHTLCRMTELFSMRCGELCFSPTATWLSINLGFTKGGSRRGVQDTAIVDAPWLATALKLISLNRPPGDLLFQCSAGHFRKAFQRAVNAIGLRRMALQPYSLKRGGATALFRQLGQYDPVVQRGHWASVATARIYINDGLAMHAEMRHPPQLQAKLQPFASLALKKFESSNMWPTGGIS